MNVFLKFALCVITILWLPFAIADTDLFLDSLLEDAEERPLHHTHLLTLEKAIAAHNFQKHARVLDIGSGDGCISALLANTITSGQVVGIDTAQHLVNLAQRNHQHIQSLGFEYMDAHALKFDTPFDAITLFNTLEELTSPQTALQEIEKNLTLDGIVYIYSAKPNPTINKLRENYFQRSSNTSSTIECLNDWLIQAQLYRSEQQEFKEQRIFPDKETFKSWLMIALPEVMTLPIKQQQNALDGFVDAYIQQFPPKNGRQIAFQENYQLITAKKLKS